MARKQNVRHNNRSRNKGQNGGGGQQSHKQRNTYKQHLERYTSLAKDAASNGDEIVAEGYRQYAEHYFRQLSALPQAPEKKQNKNPQQKEGGESKDSEAKSSPSKSPAPKKTEGEASSTQDGAPGETVEIDLGDSTPASSAS